MFSTPWQQSVACAARLDKGAEDLTQGRPIWPWAWLAGLADDVTWMQMIGAQRELEHGAGELTRLAGELAARVEAHGREVAHAHLASAHAALAAYFPAQPALLAALAHEMCRLEASYG